MPAGARRSLAIRIGCFGVRVITTIADVGANHVRSWIPDLVGDDGFVLKFLSKLFVIRQFLILVLLRPDTHHICMGPTLPVTSSISPMQTATQSIETVERQAKGAQRERARACIRVSG